MGRQTRKDLVNDNAHGRKEEALFLGTEVKMYIETFMLMIPSVRLSKSLHSCFAM